MSALAEEPERLEAVFHHEEKYDINGISINGIYAFNFWALMFPITITIDDRIPLKIGKPAIHLVNQTHVKKTVSTAVSRYISRRTYV